MPAHHSLHIALTGEFRGFMARLVDARRCQSSSYVARPTQCKLAHVEPEPPGVHQAGAADPLDEKL
jgi:hypothetical protein